MNVRNILIVDDDPNLRKSLSEILRAKRYAPTAVATGKAALNSVEEAEPAVALIDLKLADMSGLEVMRKIKERSSGTECIMLTGHATQVSAIEAVNLGAYSYVQKPYDVDGLLVTIRRAIEKWEAEETLERKTYQQERLLETARHLTESLDVTQVLGRIGTGAKEILNAHGCAIYLLDPKTTTTLTPVVAIEPPYEEKILSTPLDVKSSFTDRKQMEKRILRQERLSAVGQLAAGIAHDFNNLLTGVIGYAELLGMRADIPETAKTDLKRIVRQGQRAAHLVRQILDFSRQSSIQRRPLNLVSFLKESIKFLERTIPESVNIALEMAPEEYPVNADPAQMQQVLTNLAVNARDAMPDGGELRFRLSRFTLTPDERPPLPEMSPGEWVELSVSDTGTGIEPEHLTRLYEPFFTTKRESEGTGLGLSQVHGIVTQHDGFIDVKSEVGEGTAFIIYLPTLVTDESGRDVPAEEEVPVGTETVLFVEDEPVVLSIGQEMLESLGYTVLTAPDGGEALDVYRARRDEIALVVTDLVMPQMGGLVLYRALKWIDAKAKVVAVTGYSARISENELQTLGFNGLIQKPFQRDEVARVVREALDG